MGSGPGEVMLKLGSLQDSTWYIEKKKRVGRRHVYQKAMCRLVLFHHKLDYQKLEDRSGIDSNTQRMLSLASTLILNFQPSVKQSLLFCFVC